MAKTHHDRICEVCGNTVEGGINRKRITWPGEHHGKLACMDCRLAINHHFYTGIDKATYPRWRGSRLHTDDLETGGV